MILQSNRTEIVAIARDQYVRLEIADNAFDFPIAITRGIKTAATVDFFCQFFAFGVSFAAAFVGLGARLALAER